MTHCPRFRDSTVVGVQVIRVVEVHSEPVAEDPRRSSADIELSLAQRIHDTSSAMAVLFSAQSVERRVGC